MRPASSLGCLALAALLGLAGAARAASYDAVIQVETDVLSGHGDSPMYYASNHLHVGDRVRVLQEVDGGWLGIQPPAGSFSWIRKDLLYIDSQKQPPVMVVNAEAADVRIGSDVSKAPPLVIGKRVARGTILTPLPKGTEHPDNEGVWVPIYPPEGEMRYIRAAAVQKPAAAPDRTASAFPVPPASNAAPGVQDAEALYKRAIDAEKFNPQEAIALYNQGANYDANPDRRLQALNRANWLRDNLRNPTATLVPGPPPGAAVSAASAPAESKVYPLTPDPGPSPAVRLSPPQGSGAATSTVSATPTATWNTTTQARAPATPATAGGSYSSGPGWLQNSYQRPLEGGKMYVLLSDRGVPFYYVTPEPGVDLDSYVKRRVELFGQAIYSGQLRANYMRVSRVELREGQ